MDARIEQGLAPSTHSSPQDAELKPSSLDRTTMFAVRIICICGLLLANYYAWTMTVTGFVGTKFLPNNSVLPNAYIPEIVAGFIQLGILAFYLTVPYFHWRRFAISLMATIFAISLIGLSALFALFSITMTSQSANIVGHEIGLITGMNKEVMDLDELISTTFQNHLNGLDTLSKRACAGKDKTGVPICGPIAKGYIERENAIRDKYGSQLNGRSSYKLPSSENIMDLLTTLQGNYLKLSQKVNVYRAFTSEENLSSHAVTRAFNTLGEKISSFDASLHHENPDAKTLVLNRVFDEVARIVKWKAGPISYFALFISFLPDLLSATFTCLLIIVRSASHESVALRRAVNKAYEEAKLYDRLGGATEALHRAKQNWRNRRRFANVAEAVDASVPDLA